VRLRLINLTYKNCNGILIPDMDELDSRIIDQLRRIQRLEDIGAISFRVTVNPAKMGYEIIALLALEVDLDRIDEVSGSLASCPNVRYVSLCTGNHDIFAGAWFKSSIELTKFVKEYLSTIHGIRRSETFIVLDVKKNEAGWLGISG